MILDSFFILSKESRMSHPCLNINLDERSIQATPTTLSFQMNIRSYEGCDYRVYATSQDGKHSVYRDINAKGVQTISFNNLYPDTPYNIRFENFFRNRGTYATINGRYEYYTMITRRLITTLTLEAFQFNARGEIALSSPEIANNVTRLHVSLINLGSGARRTFYSEWEVSNDRLLFALRSLDVDTRYRVETELTIKNMPMKVINTEEFATRVARCTFRSDKVSVLSNRMSYFLTYSKIDHLLKKLFHKMALHFIQLDPSIFTNRNQNEIDTLSGQINSLFALSKQGVSWSSQQKANKNTFKARKDALIQKSKDTKAARREAIYLNAFEQVRNFLTEHTGYERPIEPLHIELYHLLIGSPSSDTGSTAKFMNQFFPGMNHEQRRNYFAEGFPGDPEEFILFLKCLVKNPEDINPEGFPTKERPEKSKNILRFVLRGSNISDPEGYFGYIFMSNSAGGKDEMLTHLSIGGAYTDPVKKTLYMVKGTPLTYHITDVCFDFRNFYRFENDSLVLQTGDRRDYNENPDGSVSFRHADPGQAPQDTTIRLTDFKVVVEGARRGGGVSTTRKVKRSKRAKTRRSA